MRIAFFELKAWEGEYLTHQLQGAGVDLYPAKLSEDTAPMAQDCEIISVFVDSLVGKQVIDALPKLKMIATRATGYDNIDVDYCRQKNITVCNVPYYGENTVAEHTFALILDLSRKIYQSISRVKEEGFAIDLEPLRGFDLKGKTLGIVGMGHIGQHVGRMAGCFGMNILAYDVHEDKGLAKKLGLTYVKLDELLHGSDIVTLHVPYNEHTRHLINSKNIHLMKRGSYLINTARGGVIETAALIEGLGKGIIAGAGLDVLEEEVFIKEEAHLLSKDYSEKSDIKTMLHNHILMDQKNVIITPHNAFNSKEALERILATTVENIQLFIKGKKVNNV